MAFFWRIFLSAWAFVLITVAVTVWAGSLLSEPEGPSIARFAERMVSLVAQDLRVRMAHDPETAVEHLANEQMLQFPPLLEVFILDQEGNDVLGRSLPAAVLQVQQVGGLSSESAELPQRVHLRSDGLNGYMVVGYEGYFLLANVLMRPGARGLLIALMLVVSAAVSFLLARFIVLPVRRLQLAGQKVADGDLSVRIAHTVGNRTDDIAKLAQGFDVMTKRVDALLQSQQRLMRDVSHELRSPLARLQALLSIARQTADATGCTQIDRMETELERLDQLIGEILAFTRLEARAEVTRHLTDVVDLTQNIVDDASLEGHAAGKQIRMQGPQRLLVEVDSGLIQSAVENVVRNALKYTEEGTAVEIRIASSSDCCRITIDDHGPGVPDAEIDKIFEPFFRVEESRTTISGTGGIGLAIAERSIRLHGGDISAFNRQGGGLRIEITVPCALP